VFGKAMHKSGKDSEKLLLKKVDKMKAPNKCSSDHSHFSKPTAHKYEFGFANAQKNGYGVVASRW